MSNNPKDLLTNEIFDVKDKVVVVTGGTRGIGFMIASGFYVNGATVYINSRKKEDCEKAAAGFDKINSVVKNKGKFHTFVTDLATEEGCIQYANFIKEREQRVDVLVNNAGTSWAESIETYPDHAWDKLMALNVKAAFFMVKHLLPLLRKGKEGASVINIGSVSGETISKLEYYAYSASKAALHHLTRHLASRLAVDKIRVNCLACGFFLTRLTQVTFENSNGHAYDSIPLGRGGSATDIAGTCMYLSSKAGAWTTGAVLPLDGGFIVQAHL
jgi:NAD(P)-dependent dehydrogenase (short-subunit alcohol dehydrogenase family)